MSSINFHKKAITLPIPGSRNELIITISALLAVFISLIYPASTITESAILKIFLFFIFPFFVISIVLNKSPRDFGLNLKKEKEGLFLALIITIIFLLTAYFVIFFTNFNKFLSFYKFYQENFLKLALYYIFYTAPTLFSITFIYQGFFILGTKNKFKIWSIFAQAALFALVLYPFSWLDALAAFIASVLTGYVTYRTGSMVYSFLSLWIISLGIDIMIIRLLNYGG